MAILNDWRRGFAAGQGQRDLILPVTVALVIAKVLFWPLYLWLVGRYQLFKVEFWIASLIYFFCVCVTLNSGIRSVRLRRIHFAFSGDLVISALLIVVAIILSAANVQGSLTTGNLGHLSLILWIAAFLEFTRAAAAISPTGPSRANSENEKQNVG